MANVLDIVVEKGEPVIDKIYCAVDCGIVVNPDAAKNLSEGGLIDGIGHALYSSMSFKEGDPEQQNFDNYRLIRHSEAPREIQVDFVKNDIICNLKEEFSSAFVNGIINLDVSKQHEIRSKINHLSENTKSYQLIKCALKEKSKAVYQGKIFVDSVAQKTDGYQLSKAILLNEGTEFNGKPELEIYADDVKCSHGSSSGNLDENKIFYLMTRGLSKTEAKKILLDGFFLEVIEKITDTKVKDLIKELMEIR